MYSTVLNEAVYYCAGIEDLCTRRDELHKQILSEEEEKAKLQNEIRCLTDRLAKVNESLSKKMASRAEFDRTIAETEAAYTKVCLCCYFVDCMCQQSLMDSCALN